MHYELKGRHEVCFKAKIWLTGLVVNSKAKNLTTKCRSLKRFRLPCQVQRLGVSVVDVVDRVFHCAEYTDHLNYNKGSSQYALDLPRLLILKPKKSHPGFLLT